MRDEDKTKVQLIKEMCGLRQRIKELEKDLNLAGLASVQNRMDKVVQESETEFRTLVEKMPDAVAYLHALDKPNTLLYTSPQVEKMLGYTARELQQESGGWLNYIHPDDHERVLTEFKRCQGTGQNFVAEYRVIKKDGEVVWLHDVADVLCDANGRLTSILGVAFNISARKRAEEALGASAARYRNIFEHATEGIFQTTPEGRYLSINPAFARMFGYSSQEEMVAAISDIGGQLYVHPEDRERFKQLLTAKGRVERFEAQVYRRDGGIIWISSNARVVRDATGTVLYYEGTTEDITERKEMESTLRERERELEAKSLDLEEINTALRVLLKRHEEDQRDFATSVLSNLKELVFPYLEKLRNSPLSDLQRTYMSVVESHLKEIGAPFLGELSRQFTNLSRTERQIAILIKDGKRNKEIAEILGVSVNTILTHRYHLRTKLGLKNKNINLISYLKSISTL